MKKIQLCVITAVLLLTMGTREVMAIDTVHMRIVGSKQTLWVGDVKPSGCTVTDTSNIAHTYSQPVAICQLDQASKLGKFSYEVKDYGGSLGLFIKSIGPDQASDDFSTYWLYDLNGKAADTGISNQLITAGDSLFFHFFTPSVSPKNRAINDGIHYLSAQQDSSGKITGFDGVSAWSAIAFAANGIDPHTISATQIDLITYLANHPPSETASATELERDILAIVAAGDNPHSFGGIDYLQRLSSLYVNHQIGSETLLNDDIFGALALISGGETGYSHILQDTISFISTHQRSDGGFSWSTTGTSDADTTAAAVQALFAADNLGISSTDALIKAEAYLLSTQEADGGFTTNTSTTTWALMALNILPDSQIRKSARDKAQEYILANQKENGSFAWQSTVDGETFTTSYALIALSGKGLPLRIHTVLPTITIRPTYVPTLTPTKIPSATPTSTPTIYPSNSPTGIPTKIPTPTSIPGRLTKKRLWLLKWSELLRIQRENVVQRVRIKFRYIY